MADYVVEFGKDGRPVEPDGRLDAPAFHRNHRRSAAVLQRFLAGKSGDVVEAGSGTGQHVVDFARHTPDITWWPSDLNEQHLKSIAAWRAHAGLANIRPPLRIDLSDPAWCPEMQDGSGPEESAGGVLRQCDPHRAVARGGRAVRGRRALSAGGRAAVSVRAVQARRQAHRASAMRCSTPACAKAIPNGACAISRPWRSWPAAPVLRWSKSPRCPPTI